MRKALAGYLRELGGEPTAVVCFSTALLIVSHYQGAIPYFRVAFGDAYDKHPAAGALGHFWWFGCSVLLFLVMPLVVSVAFKGSFHRRYGLGLGDARAALPLCLLFLAVMLPTTFVASKLDAFKGLYPLAGQAAFTLHPAEGPERISVPLFLLYEAGYLAYFVAWEFFFRGWMLNALLPRFGRAGALLIPMVPFALMHLGKAELEALGSIVAGLALGVLALRTRSFWYGFVLHGVIAVWMDVLSSWDALTRPTA